MPIEKADDGSNLAGGARAGKGQRELMRAIGGGHAGPLSFDMGFPHGRAIEPDAQRDAASGMIK
ncbi:hypothetical protein PPGU19_039550 [Paraburkholderia sp. PGU19]|nr:hypothetical protein PPGU19_039550 [Paraburkholderia sp. PGU19]